MKFKKKKSALSPFCYLGDPVKGEETFNKNMGNNANDSVSTESAEVSGGMIAESSVPTYTFKYFGPIYRFKRYIGKTKEPVYTDAQNEYHAATMIKGKLKKQLGYSYDANLDIDMSKLEKLDNRDDYEMEIKNTEKEKEVEYPEDKFVETINGHDVYYIDGYYLVDGLPNKKFISDEDIFDYFGM